MLAVFKKELRSYFNTLIGYVFLGFFILVVGFYFCITNVWGGSPYFNTVLASTLIMLLVLIPVLTMRLFSEESRQKTDQLLFTSPLSIWQIVIGKFAAAAALFLLGTLIIGLFPVILSFYGSVPVQETLGGLIGYFLMGCGFISVGFFISVLTDNQIIAAVGTFAAMFFIYMVDGIASLAPVTTSSSIVFICLIILFISFIIYNSTKNVYAAAILAIIGFAAVAGIYLINSLLFDGIITKVLGWFSILSRFDNFTMGVFNAADVIYYITFTIAFLYLSVNVIEKRRWR